jgi:predicted dehydrogenase
MTRVKIGIIGTGAIAAKHAQAWQNIGCPVTACTNKTAEKGREFAARFGARFIPTMEELCRDADVELVDICTFPDYRIEPVSLCASLGKPVQLQKPIARNLTDANRILELGRDSGITMGVVSQHRFDDSAQFLDRALASGRMGRLLQADCFVKWYRPPSYYSRPIKGSWATEGGGALINQAIHQVDLLRWLAGPVQSVCANWKLGAVHQIESEDIVNALLTFESGALGVIQAATAFWPGYPERVELHGTKGSAIITGDRLTHWDVENDSGEPAPLAQEVASGASDPMAISLVPFERQFTDLLAAIQERRQPAISAQDGVNALAIVEAVYESCRTGQRVVLS